MIVNTQSDTDQLDQTQRSRICAAAAILNQGGIVAFPTETVYGLGADATNSAAVQKIYAIKQRPVTHPLILHISNIAHLQHWSRDIPETAWMLAERFWPGPLTLILQRSQYVPDCVTGGQDTVGIRVPAHATALALLNAMHAEKAIAAPSANLYGRISPTTSAHVQAALAGKVDMILDGGPCQIGLESTIVRADQQTVSILRPGGVSVAEIESALNRTVSLAYSDPGQTVRVSGALRAIDATPPAHKSGNRRAGARPCRTIFSDCRYHLVGVRSPGAQRTRNPAYCYAVRPGRIWQTALCGAPSM